MSIIYRVIANVLSNGLVIFLGWVYYNISECRNLLKFFRIQSEKLIDVYLSRILTIQEGSIGVDGLAQNNEGCTLVNNEQAFATMFKEKFSYLIPSLINSRSFLGNAILGSIKADIFPSLMNISYVERTASIISIGSSGFNVVSSMIEDTQNSGMRFLIIIMNKQ